MKQGIYPSQAKGNVGKYEIRSGNYAGSIVKSNNHSTVNQNNLTIYHPNIKGINKKTDELLLSFTLELPHIICLSEHHLKDYEISAVSMKNIRLGGVCIFVKENVQFSKINNTANCKEKDL
jgi:hypothetical protein